MAKDNDALQKTLASAQTDTIKPPSATVPTDGISPTVTKRQVSRNTSAPIVFEQGLVDWFKHNMKRMVSLTGDKETAKRFVITLSDLAKTNPRIMACSIDSIGHCLLQCASLGLLPSPFNECALVPFKNTLTFMPQYQGLCKLAYQSGVVRSINSGVI